MFQSFQVKAYSSASLIVGSANGFVDTNVDVSVNISENSGLAAGSFILDYDPTQLDVISAVKGAGFAGGSTSVNYSEPGTIKIAFAVDGGILEGGSILDITYKIKSTASGIIPLTLSVEEMTDDNFDDISYDITNGSIEVDDSESSMIINNSNEVNDNDFDTTTYNINTVVNSVTLVPFFGDVTGNGIVQSSDSLKILQYVSGKITLTDTQKLVGDVTRNGLVQSSDALKVLQHVSGKIIIDDCGGTIEDAYNWAPDITKINGYIGTPVQSVLDVDVFKFKAPSSGYYNFYSTNSNLEAKITNADNVVLVEDEYSIEASTDFKIECFFEENVTYYIHINSSIVNTKYHLNISLPEPTATPTQVYNTPFPKPTGIPIRSNNHAYLPTEWFNNQEFSVEDIQAELVKMKDNSIEYLFCDIGSYTSTHFITQGVDYNNLARWISLAHSEGFQVIAWVNAQLDPNFVNTSGNATNYGVRVRTDLENLSTLLAITGLRYNGINMVDGFQVDFEPSSTYFAYYYTILTSVRSHIGSKHLSTATPMLNGSWEDSDLESVVEIVDMVNPMLYDGYAENNNTQAEYISLVRDTCIWYSDIIESSTNNDCQLSPIAPVYPETTDNAYHHITDINDNPLETLENAVAGFHLAMNEGANIYSAGVFYWACYIGDVNYEPDYSYDFFYNDQQNWLEDWVYMPES